MFKALTLSAVLTLSALAAGTASADDKEGVYVNIGVTQLGTEQDLTNTDVGGQIVDLGVQDLDITMLNGRLGYRLNDYFAVEGEVGFGVGGDSFSRDIPVTLAGTTVTVPTDFELDVDNYYIAFAKGILPVGEQFDVFARVGYGQATAKGDITASLAGITATGSAEDKADDIAYGVGAQFNFTDKDGIRADYTRLDKTDILSLAYARRF